MFDGRIGTATLMPAVIELGAQPHHDAVAEDGYRVEVRDCFRCWREMHVYVPTGGGAEVGPLVTDVACPHCHRWDAETLVTDVSTPILVRACQRSELEWWALDLRRLLRIGAARVRVAVKWPYWAIHRMRLRMIERRTAKTSAEKL